MATNRAPNKLRRVINVYNENTGENSVPMPNSYCQKKREIRKFSKLNPETVGQSRPLLLRSITNNVPRMDRKIQHSENVRCAPKLIDLETDMEIVDSGSELVDMKPNIQWSIFSNPNKCWGCETCDQEFPNYDALLKHVVDTNCNCLISESLAEQPSSISSTASDSLKRQGESMLSTAANNVKNLGKPKLSTAADGVKFLGIPKLSTVAYVKNLEKPKLSTGADNVKNLGKLKFPLKSNPSTRRRSYGKIIAKTQQPQNYLFPAKPKTSGNSLFNFCSGLKLNPGLMDLGLDGEN